MKKYHVFISYSRKDDVNFFHDTGVPSLIDEILAHFKKENIIPWIDREGRYCGASFQKEIIEALENSEMVLFISSKNSNNDESRYIFSEINLAFEMKKRILPLLMDDTPFNAKIGLVLVGIDQIEYYKNHSKGLKNLVINIKEHLKERAAAEKAEAEAKEAERHRIEEENARTRAAAEEEKRKEKLRNEIARIKKRIADLVERQSTCMQDLETKEKELNGSLENNIECPVCHALKSNDHTNFCDICGWYFMSPEELVSPEKQASYEERLDLSRTIWEEKQKRKDEIELLRREQSAAEKKLEERQRNSEKEQKVYLEREAQYKKQLQEKTDEIAKLKEELRLLKKQSSLVQNAQPVAFLLVSEYEQQNVYCLFEGCNVFGAMQSNEPDYQMLVVSEPDLQSRHFEILIKKENTRFIYVISPFDSSCKLGLNGTANIIEDASALQINDMFYIGNVKIQLIDNFNK